MSQTHSPERSLCMIVRNEEHFIADFIRRHREFFDDWVIVDTGSTDRTREIIEQAGLPVYHFAWIDDFAAARNYALSKCKGKWVGAFDADEFLDRKTMLQLPLFMQRPEVIAIEMQIKNYISEENMLQHCSEYLVEYHPPDGSYLAALADEPSPATQDHGYRLTRLPRFFRRDAGFKWISPIHEVLTQSDGATQGKTAVIEGLCIHHLGMLDLDGKAHAKQAQYQDISQKLLPQVENSNDPKLLFEGARFATDPNEKIRLLERARKGAPRDLTILKELANTHLKMDNPVAAIECCDLMIASEPENLEPYLARARCRSVAGELEEGIEQLKQMMRTFRSESMFYYTLATLSVEARKLPNALSYAQRAHSLSPNSPMIASLLEKLRAIESKLS